MLLASRPIFLLDRHLPTSDVLSADQQIGDPEGYRSQLLYSEPGGALSIVALVWRPGQVTAIHDHVTWCVFVVIRARSTRVRLDEERGCLVEAGATTNREGDVSGFAPLGDIHRLRNAGDQTAILLHVYGTDVSRIGSSVRRYYDQPVPAAH